MSIAARYAAPAVHPTPASPEASPIPVGEIYREARASYGAASGTWIFATLIALGLGLGAQLGIESAFTALTTDPTLRLLLGAVANGFVHAFLGAGFGLLVLDGLRGEPLSVGRVFRGGRFVWPMFVVSTLSGLGAVALAALFIVPGVIFHLATSQATWLVLDRGLDPWSALRESLRITKGHRARLLWLELAQMLVIAAGVFALGVGVLVAWPLTQLMAAHAYRRLVGEETRAD